MKNTSADNIVETEPLKSEITFYSFAATQDQLSGKVSWFKFVTWIHVLFNPIIALRYLEVEEENNRQRVSIGDTPTKIVNFIRWWWTIISFLILLETFFGFKNIHMLLKNIF